MDTKVRTSSIEEVASRDEELFLFQSCGNQNNGLKSTGNTFSAFLDQYVLVLIFVLMKNDVCGSPRVHFTCTFLRALSYSYFT